MEQAAEDDNNACLSQVLVWPPAEDSKGSYLNNENDNGILGVIFAGIGALENASLLCCSRGGGGSSSSFGGHSRSDRREYCAGHSVRLCEGRFLESLGCPQGQMYRERQLGRARQALQRGRSWGSARASLMLSLQDEAVRRPRVTCECK